MMVEIHIGDIVTDGNGGERFVRKGGEGSGNFDHAGRPGEVGGSASSNSGESVADPVAAMLAMVTAHDAAGLDNDARRKAVEDAGYKWKDYKRVRFDPAREVDDATRARWAANAAAKAEEAKTKVAEEKAKLAVDKEARLAAAKAQAHKLEEERHAQAKKEIEENANVEPHWPTYRTILASVHDYNEYRNARRYADVGDVLAFKHAAEDFQDLVHEHIIDAGHFARDVWQTIERSGKITDKQAKVLAVAISKVHAKKIAEEDRMAT
jgi:hypothetical protein